MRGEGDTDAVKMELPTDLLIEFDVGEDTGARFSAEYLAVMAKGLNVDQFTLYLKTDNPLKATCSDECMDVAYMIAPRIDD